MKTAVFKILMGLSLVVLFTGCDLFETADDITIDIEIQHTFVIDENEEHPDGKEYIDIGIIDATKDETFDKYKDKIKEFTVHEVLYTVADVAEGHDAFFQDGMGIFYADADTTMAIATAHIGSQSIGGSVGQEFKLAYNVQGLNAIAQQLESVHQVFFVVRGKLTKTPAAFSVPVTLKCTIKADALD